ncbi:glutamate-rich WD repeat-containing protein 1-like [Dendronephthya gigantea]|uniref:glutamate-rich WD repeat-containing protein 1-like n=1 Tax=Dendronephthya gigantea TaxID=151771 RepID=UPI00106CB7DD|nr:glutamate-rich WD repeat-containing protein 1-like [Dendronephthya gigantea]
MEEQDQMDTGIDIKQETNEMNDIDDNMEASGSSSTAVSTSSNVTGKNRKKKKKKKKKKPKTNEASKNSEIDTEEVDDGGEASQTAEETEPQVYLPGGPMEEGEELNFDSSAYKMYHQVQCGAPCLSFDIIPDNLGDNRTEFPMTMYLAAGTQSESSKQNYLIVLKMSDLQEMEEEQSDEEDAIDDEPDLTMGQIKHNGAVNRVKFANIPGRQVVSTWSETGKVHIWDISRQFIEIDNDDSGKNVTSDHKPLYTFRGHQTEGFAMDWSRTVPGRLLTGDCNRNIHLWNPTEDNSWQVDQRPYSSHTKSVEDLQWSPNEATVFASCSVDKTIKVWDIRAAPSKACMLTAQAHDADVNVISWNRNEPLLVSGGDDGAIKVWDLRQFQSGEPIAVFKHHTDAITSVEWSSTDNSVFAASGSDNQITLWDLAVERDDEGQQGRPVDVPPQLLFIHMGQKDIKELHWHAQLPGVVVSTAEDSFNVFKTISV